MRKTLTNAALVLALLSGCELPSDFDRFHVPAAAGTRLDAGDVVDAGTRLDAGDVVDAGTRLDAGDVVDAGTRLDAGDVVDAGTRLDAGDVVDAGTRLDAGDVVDAGTPLPACKPPGFGFYMGACGCTLTSCSCLNACSRGGSIACCDPSEAPTCRCEP